MNKLCFKRRPENASPIHYEILDDLDITKSDAWVGKEVDKKYSIRLTFDVYMTPKQARQIGSAIMKEAEKILEETND